MSTVLKPTAPSVSHEVAARFHALRRRCFTVKVTIATVLAATMMGCLWLLLAASDYFWEWPHWGRSAGLGGGALVVLVWWAQRALIAFRWTRERTFAHRLETVFGDFGQRIRTVLDTVEGRIHGPQAMLAALGHQTLGRWETLTPATLIPWRTLAFCGGGLMLVLVTTWGSFFAGSDWQKAMMRSLGSEVPYTTMTVSPGDTRILEGSVVTVSLQLHGRLNRDVALRYRDVMDHEANTAENTPAASVLTTSELTASELAASESGWIETELLPMEAEPAHFQLDFGKTNRSIEYQFLTSIGDTRIYRVDVQPLIELRGIEVNVQPPAYTQLETRKFSSADVAVLQSSQVQVDIEVNHPLHEARLEIGPKASQLQSVPLTPGDDPTHWTFALPSESSAVWRFSGSGRDQTPMNPVVGRLRVHQDAAPRIAWRDPTEAIRVQSLAELPMRAQISDDYGVTAAGIVFQIGDHDEYVLTEWTASTDGDAVAGATTRLHLDEVLPLESFALSERDYISYYAFAIDNREPQAQRAESDVRYIDIRPLRQFFSEIERETRLDGGGPVLVQLDELIRRQRVLINRTRRMTRQSSSELASQLGTLDRMVASQSELAGLTRFLAEFFVSQGNDDVEALHQAESAMLQAADSLAAASFDLGLAQEHDALRSLAEARRTLQIFLIKNATPAQQQAYQQFARRMQQKLRRNRDVTAKQLADELKRIAASQSQLGALARQIQGQTTATGSSGVATNPNNTTPPTSGQGKMSAEESSDEALTADDETQPPGQADAEREEMVEETANENVEEIAPDASDQLTQQQRQDELFASELDLLERLRAIEERIQDQLTASPLLLQRMQTAQAALDGLALSAREGSLETYGGASEDAADQLREMGLQLDAISATEPVKRVSALRDMTTSLANMEPELADQGRDAEMGAKRLGRQLKRRAETIADVLQTPASAGDIEDSDVSEFLAQFIAENDFIEQLDATQSAATDYLNDDLDAEPGAATDAYERARIYADAATQLDALYRQLVEPQLARLKAIEKRATAMAQALKAGGKAAEDAPETKAELGTLKRELGQEGLSELAAALDEGAAATGEDVSDLASSGPSDAGRFSPDDSRSLAKRTGMLVRELRKRIQEMILLEVAADRDAPVPTQYRGAVDDYFRTIAGDDVEMTGMTTP